MFGLFQTNTLTERHALTVTPYREIHQQTNKQTQRERETAESLVTRRKKKKAVKREYTEYHYIPVNESVFYNNNFTNDSDVRKDK